ncbi:hypothetical protein [Evansella halocellulosilytica]|nr:hypothetical protein [Evansella halocellulosilytica]
MMKFILEDSDETLSTHSGLGLMGVLLSKGLFGVFKSKSFLKKQLV